MQTATPVPDSGPASHRVPSNGEPAPAHNEATNGFPPLVVLVDDDPGVLSAVRRALSPLPLRLAPFPDAHEALEYLRHNDPALIVSDFHMPGLDGAQLLDAAHALCPVSVRALFTARADLQVVSEAASRGAISCVIPKPWDAERLTATVLELAASGLNARISAALPAFQAALLALPSSQACRSRLREFLLHSVGLVVTEEPPSGRPSGPWSVYREGTGTGLGVELTPAHCALARNEAQRSRLLALLDHALHACLFASASMRA